MATDYNNLGLAYRDGGEVVKGLELITKSYNILKDLFGDDHVATKTLLENVEKTKAMMKSK